MLPSLAAAIRQDVRDALRTWRTRPRLVAAAVLTIGLGIGANTAVFSVVNALLFRPLPVRDAAQLVVIAASRSSALGPVSFPDLEDYREGTRDVLEDAAGYTVGFVGLAAEGGRPSRVLATWVTGRYFPLLGLQPALGRLIGPDEVQPGQTDPVAVLGYTAWQTRFAGAPEVIGRRVTINGRPCTIVGVAPASFTGTFAFSNAEVYLPVNWATANIAVDRSVRTLHTLARLRRGVTADRAQATLNVVADRLARDYPDTDAAIRLSVLPEPLARPEEQNARSNAFGAAIMLLLVGLVLLVAEVNLANLLLARAAGRRTELAVRAALGASRGRIVQQQMIESPLLVGLGGIVGIGLGAAVAQLLTSIRPPGDLPVRLDFHLDARVVAYGWALTTITALTIGWISARRAVRVDFNDVLRDHTASGTASARNHRLRKALVVGQFGVCLTLLVTAGLFRRSLTEAEHASFGFRPDEVLNVHVDVGEAGYDEARGRVFFDRMRQQVAAIPGVDRVALAATAPLDYVRLSAGVEAEGVTVMPADRLMAGMNVVDPDYFFTLGIGIQAGRGFTDGDDADESAVAVVNRRLADVLWPGRDPVGRRFRRFGTDAKWMTVVGVTGTGKYRSLFEAPLPYFYVPLAQQYTPFRVLHIRSTVPAASLALVVEQRIRALAPELPLYDVQPMTAALGGGYGLFAVRTAAAFAGVLALIGGLLAFSGLYALVSFMTAERTREIGIRIALGARRAQITAMVLREGGALAVLGTAFGLLGAFGVARLLARLLFGVSPADPFSFAGAALGLAMIALAAAYLPARRATRVDPITTLRSL